MVSSASSRGVKAARRVSLLRRLTQYLQSNTQLLVINTFSRVMHRPSAEKLWQQPAIEEVVLPIIPGRALRLTPLEVQAASYLAASVRMASLSSSSMPLHRAAALLGAIQPVDDMNGAAGEESHAHHHHNKSKGRHSTYLL